MPPRSASVVALLFALGCSEPTAADHTPMSPAPDESYDVTVGRKSMAYVVPPGHRMLRLRTKCLGCSKSHFVVDFLLEGRARPPISLTLVADGKTVANNPFRNHDRCFEDNIPQTTPPTQCTLLVAYGWDKLRDERDERTFDLILENDGPARDATLSFDFESVPRD